MEATAAFSAILAIADSFIKMARYLRKRAKQLKHAREVIERLSKETKMLSHLLGLFYDALESARTACQSDLSDKIIASKIGQQVKAAGQACLSRLEKVLRKVDSMRHDSKTNLLKYYVACIRWKDDSEEIKSIYSIMDSVKLSSQMLMGIIAIDLLTAKLQRLQAQGQPAPGALVTRMTQLVMRNTDLKRECRKLKRECSRLQAIAEQPELTTNTSEVINSIQTLIQEHVEKHPAVKQLITRHPKQIPAIIRELSPPAVPAADGENRQDESGRGTPDLTSTLTASSTNGTSTVDSNTATEHQSQLTEIVGPSSRYRRSAYQVALPGVPRATDTNLRRQSAHEGLAEHYIHMSKDDVIREGVRQGGGSHSGDGRNTPTIAEEGKQNPLGDVPHEDKD